MAETRVAEPVWGVLASANYFDVLGVKPLVGRGFLPARMPSRASAPVVVISHALWQRRFAGDAGVIGRPVWIRDHAMTIVGVAPPDFYGTISHLAMDLWIPVTMQPEVSGGPYLLYQRGVRWLGVFGRLAPGATLETARASAQASGARLAASFAEDRDIGLTARVLDVGPVDRMAPLFTVMLGISALVLLIVCSNVANLLLQRGAAREHEMAVRLALGARPGAHRAAADDGEPAPRGRRRARRRRRARLGQERAHRARAALAAADRGRHADQRPRPGSSSPAPA